MGKGIIDRVADSLWGSKSSGITVRELTDRDEIREILDRERAYAATVVVYLEPKYSHNTRCYLAEGESEALCLQVLGTYGSAIFTMGDTKGVAAILRSRPCPRSTYMSFQPSHLGLLRSQYFLYRRQSLARMYVTTETFTTIDGAAVPLSDDQFQEVNALYSVDGTGWVSRQSIAEGVYYGVWDGRKLVSVAGTQSISRVYGVGVVANVFTHPDYRGQGYATACTGAVTAKLMESCDYVVLNVDPTNTPAVRAYTKLGYREEARLEEAWGFRHGLSWLGGISVFLDRLLKG
ncbi:MAG: family N-acetyltransferase [Dehalococcoidia bacterium]|nr:family N-acetyltransferase [Dehalococcoidia bacterium]